MFKKFVAVAFAFAGLAATEITPAQAVVCASGPARAGCVSRYGAVGVRRAPVRAPVVVNHTVVRRRTVVVR